MEPSGAQQLNIHEAKTQLSKLVARVEAGEEFVIARSGQPVARLVPFPGRTPASFDGCMKGRLVVPDDIDDVDGEIEQMFGGR